MTNMPQNQHCEPKKFTGKHMLIIMCCFFGVIITVNMIMAYIASNSWTGLVVKSSYVASQHYNEKLVDAARQREIGLYSDATYQNDTFSFTLRDKDKQALPLKAVSIKLGRPAFEQEDKILNFNTIESETLSLPLALKKGVWALQIEAKTAQETYRRDLRIFVNDKNGGLVE